VKVVDMADGRLIDCPPNRSTFGHAIFNLSDEIEILVNAFGLTCYNELGEESVYPHPSSEATVFRLPLAANVVGASDVYADMSSKKFSLVGFSPKTVSTGTFEVRNERPSYCIATIGEDESKDPETVELHRIDARHKSYHFMLGDEWTQPIDVPVLIDGSSLIMVSEKCDFLIFDNCLK
jgi:hypothetical protein